jgi:hypothetical protein
LATAKYQGEENSDCSILGPLFAKYKNHGVIKALFKGSTKNPTECPRGLIQKLGLPDHRLPLFTLSEHDLEQILCQIITFLSLHLHTLSKKSEYRDINILDTTTFTQPQSYLENYPDFKLDGAITMYSILFVLKLLARNHPTLEGRIEKRVKENLPIYLNILNKKVPKIRGQRARGNDLHPS